MFQKDSHMRPEEQCAEDLEKRLATYYGPQLPPHPLSEASWSRLREQLEPVASRRVRHLSFSSSWRDPRSQTIPTGFQETLTRLLSQIPYSSRPCPELRCSFKTQATPPRVSISPLGHGQVRLTLPSQHSHALQPAELEILLAAGLARCAGASLPFFLFQRALIVSTFLLAVAALPFIVLERRFFWVSLAAFACCLASAYLFAWQQRKMVFQADRQVVQWLGRERVCQGLHGLANYGHARRRLTPGEPALVERIARVCGAVVETEHDCLTLVR